MVNLTMMSKEGETILTSLRPVSWVGVVGHYQWLGTYVPLPCHSALLCPSACPYKGALHYRSMLLQIVDTVLSLIPLLFGSREEKQVVPVVLHEDYIDSFVR